MFTFTNGRKLSVSKHDGFSLNDENELLCKPLRIESPHLVSIVEEERARKTFYDATFDHMYSQSYSKVQYAYLVLCFVDPYPILALDRNQKRFASHVFVGKNKIIPIHIVSKLIHCLTGLLLGQSSNIDFRGFFSYHS